MNLIKGNVRILVICILLICSFTITDAQDYYGGGYQRRPANNPPPKEKEDDEFVQPSGYLSINFGFATPEGGFATSFGSGYGGYAEPGTLFHFSVAFPISHSNFGIALMYGNYSNNYNLNSFANNLNNESTTLAYAAVTPDDNLYAESSIMGGLFVTYPVGRFSFDCRLMIGALLCSLPEQDYATEDAAGDVNQYDIEPSNSTGLAFDAGIGVRFLIVKLGRRPLCAMLNLDYLTSNPSYDTQQDLYETPATGANAGQTYQLVPSPEVSGHIPISMLNITLGIGYQIGK